MFKGMKVAVLVCVLLVVCGAARADLSVTYVAAAFDFGILADYGAGSQTLTWSSGNAARVYTTTPGLYYDFNEVTIDLKFGGMTDLNVGGPQAEARFTTVTSTSEPGQWTLSMTNTTSGLQIDLCGELLVSGSPWAGYYEQEDGPDTNHLLGKGWVTVDSCTINGITGLEWDSNGNNLSGIKATTTLTQNIDDYQSNWSSENVELQIWTNENTIVPEPATIGLLGLGSLAMFRRRRA